MKTNIVGLEPRPALDEKQREVGDVPGAHAMCSPGASAATNSNRLREGRAETAPCDTRASTRAALRAPCPKSAPVRRYLRTTRPRSCRLGRSRAAPRRGARDVRERARCVAATRRRARRRARRRSRPSILGEHERVPRFDPAKSRGSRNMACVTTARFAEDHAEIFLFAPCEASSRAEPFFSRRHLRNASSHRRSPRAPTRPRLEPARKRRANRPNGFGARRSSTSFASDDARARPTLGDAQGRDAARDVGRARARLACSARGRHAWGCFRVS